MRRVVVTGMGAVSALGQRRRLDVGRAARRQVGRSDDRDRSTRRGSTRRSAAEVERLRPERRHRPQGDAADGPVHPVRARRGTPGARPGRASRRGWRARSPSAAACILGSGLGGVATHVRQRPAHGRARPGPDLAVLHPDGHRRTSARARSRSQFGMLGPNFATVSACATGAHAIGEAWETIRRDDADIMLAGGSEAAIHEAVVGGFSSMKALSTRNDDPEAASRPFDQGRDGFVIGEGAGMLVLEELSHAERRGAEPLAEMVGYGATADAAHITLPAPGGVGAAAGRPAAPSRRPGCRPTSSITSTPTRPRRPRATARSCRRSRRCSASTARRLDHGQQVDARAHARRGRGDRVDRDDPGDARRRRAADDQPHDPDRTLERPRPDPNKATKRDDPRGASTTRSASAARTRRSCSGGGTDDRAADDADPAADAAPVMETPAAEARFEPMSAAEATTAAAETEARRRPSMRADASLLT